MQGWGGSQGVEWVMQGRGGSYRGGWVMKGWGGSCRGGVGHAGVVWGWGGHIGVGWVMQGWGEVGHAGVGSGRSYRGWLRWVMKNIKILKILNYWCYRVSNPANQNPICRVLNFLNHDK